MTERRPKLLAIASGKGGTGKTFLATSLAHALSVAGERVLLFDGDLGLSNITVHLGVAQPMNFSAVLAGEAAAHEIAVGYGGGTGVRGGFALLAGPSGSGQFANTGGGTILRTVAALRLACGFDRVILDLAAGIDEGVMRFAHAADDVLLVLTPDPASLTDAYAFIKIYTQRARMHGIPKVPSFVVNEVASSAEARHVGAALEASCKHFLDVAPRNLGCVRRDAKVIDALRRQTLLAMLHPQSPAASDVASLAQQVAIESGLSSAHGLTTAVR